MINGPQRIQMINRIQPVDVDYQQDDNQKDERKRSVLYQGRAWAETEKDLPVQPPAAPPFPKEPPPQYQSSGVYADRDLLKRARAFFNQLSTLEEKAAQLCFFMTQASYNTAVQKEVIRIIQTCQIGGILFKNGDYRRQAYLIDRYQDVSRIPLLFANDFLHGLSFYLQGDRLNQATLSEKYYLDLGKAVMVQNHHLGVQIQFDRERDSDELPMNEAQAKAFRKGVRGVLGIVGKEKSEQNTHSLKGSFPFISANIRGDKLPLTPSGDQVLETIGFKTFTFYDATSLSVASLEEHILSAFKQLYDVFLFTTQLEEAIAVIVHLVQSGKLREEVFERHVMKSLIIKSIFFK